MNWGGPEFVLAIVAISTVGWVVNNWIRARHGYALEDEWGGKTARAEEDQVSRLRAENEALRDQLGQTLSRLENVERIVTDRSVGVAAQIEALREQPAAEGRTV